MNIPPGTIVLHPDRPEPGTVVADRRGAWTPNELTVDAPAAGMVKVRWSDSIDDSLHWEHPEQLVTGEAATRAQP